MGATTTRSGAARRVSACICLVAAALLGVIGPATGSTRSSASSTPATTWQQWQHLVGVVDIGGPRSDGALVVAAQGRLFVLGPSGALTPFARGSHGYSTTTGEPYLAVSSGQATQSGCRFARDSVFAIEQGSPPTIVQVNAGGDASRFATLPAVDALAGIAFDTVGHFGHVLLVTASRGGHGILFGVDCRAQVATLTDMAPTVEGGIAVAPDSFGPYAGSLIAVGEGSGNLVQIGPDGRSGIVVASGVPAGADIGVESVGFVPHGLTTSGGVLVADRGSQPQPHPGTDTILRLTSQALRGAGAHEGDLLGVTEGGGITVDVACAATCTVHAIASASNLAHIEGHVVATDISAQGSGGGGGGPSLRVTIMVAGATLVAAVALAVFARRKRSRRGRRARLGP